ncbi:NAD-dependent epimerase/dehydratase family protein [Granulicella mallensis]|uniref:Sterol-4-alpha-carboxylate 3-dehydrogenase (Decarboxylating) n=1 Tax=Granulicella mallensis (strain ATCC BAA-1857 / DSM 23137 / MP5ACTX8) TaxID=682795 RepID=G8P103_GRAMM|nr:NAD-dependent epimerase/dehydratase family protein [Granulicella mallensis]AEU36927.1 Sterol-4-alpha-carboxylate 3-dehydrogenase (decarboxylating) [Granulicella mallensis MP5ACTX8]
MPVLVTGASGFLGGRLAEVLAREGEQVTVLARPNADLRHLSASNVRVVRGSLTDRDSLLESVREATHIFHCAAASTDWASMEVYVESNVRGTEMLLAAAREARQLERFVHVSTTDVYGYPVIPCAENGALRDVGLPYNRTKILAEEAVWRAARKEGLPVTVVRPATIYGPRGKAFVTDIAELLQQGQMAHIAGGRTTGGFLYVDNAVDAMMSVAQSPATLGQVYNLTDGTGVRWHEYVAALADGLGYKQPWINLSYGVAMAVASVMEAPYQMLKALPGRPLLTRHAVSLLGRDQEYPSEKARTEFGFLPRVSMAEGIARSVAWLKDLS